MKELILYLKTHLGAHRSKRFKIKWPLILKFLKKVLVLALIGTQTHRIGSLSIMIVLHSTLKEQEIKISLLAFRLDPLVN
jgi:hypothetical protein